MEKLSLTTLTRREFQVAEALAWGASVKEVPFYIQEHHGGNLISEDTVKSIKKHVYEKWGIQKASELSAIWMHLHYKLSLEDTPLARLLFVIIMLIITIPAITQPNDFQRQFQSRTVRATRSARKDLDTNTYYLLLC